MFDLELESMSQAAFHNVAALLLILCHACQSSYFNVEQARSVSDYVNMTGSSSVTEKRTTTGWSFMGFGTRKTTVSPHAH